MSTEGEEVQTSHENGLQQVRSLSEGAVSSLISVYSEMLHVICLLQNPSLALTSHGPSALSVIPGRQMAEGH